MNFDTFINEWNGNQVTAYGGECVALVAQYCAENNKPIAWANAIDWWENSSLTDAFDFITNDPNDLGQLPTRGDIIIWNGDLPGSDTYGHIAIWDSRTGSGVFQSFDQNWGGPTAHFQSHTWDYVLGWATPKADPPAPAPHPDPAPANPDPAPVDPPPVVVPDLPIPPTPDPTPSPITNISTITTPTPIVTTTLPSPPSKPVGVSVPSTATGVGNTSSRFITAGKAKHISFKVIVTFVEAFIAYVVATGNFTSKATLVGAVAAAASAVYNLGRHALNI